MNSAGAASTKRHQREQLEQSEYLAWRIVIGVSECDCIQSLVHFGNSQRRCSSARTQSLLEHLVCNLRKVTYISLHGKTGKDVFILGFLILLLIEIGLKQIRK